MRADPAYPIGMCNLQFHPFVFWIFKAGILFPTKECQSIAISGCSIILDRHSCSGWNRG